MSYVASIEPRLTPLRPAAPTQTAEVLVEWCEDLREELTARLRLMSAAELAWQPHPDANSAAVTTWHVARWLDLLATRVLPRPPLPTDLWHADGWHARTGYDPDGVGFLGLGALTGFTPEEMRAVPVMSAAQLATYLGQAVDALVAVLHALGGAVNEPRAELGGSAYQLVGSTLQGAFGHVGEIDALVSLRARLGEAAGG